MKWKLEIRRFRQQSLLISALGGKEKALGGPLWRNDTSEIPDFCKTLLTHNSSKLMQKTWNLRHWLLQHYLYREDVSAWFSEVWLWNGHTYIKLLGQVWLQLPNVNHGSFTSWWLVIWQFREVCLLSVCLSVCLVQFYIPEMGSILLATLKHLNTQVV